MAVFALMDAKVTLQVGSSSAVSISSYVTGGTLEHSNDPLETTAMGSTTKTRTYGVKDWSAKIELNQDFTVIDALLWAAHNSTAVVLTVLPFFLSTLRSAQPTRSMREMFCCRATVLSDKIMANSPRFLWISSQTVRLPGPRLKQ